MATDPGLAAPSLDDRRRRRRIAAAAVVLAALLAGIAWWRAAPRTPIDPASTEVAATAAPSRAAASSRDGDADAPSFGPRAAAASISGRVHAAAGTPVAAAEVCAWPEITEHAVTTPSCTTSAANGRYRIAGIAPSRYRVTASAPGFAPGEAAATTARGTSSIALRAGEARTGVDIVLGSGGTELRGVVRDVLGGFVEGARVTLTQHMDVEQVGGPGWGAGVPVHAISTGEGRFVAWVRAGDLDVDVRADGYGRAALRVRAPGPTLEIALLPESTIAGIVLARDTKTPVAGARVVLRAWSETASQEETAAFSDDDGRFEIHGLAPGRYRPSAFADGLQGESVRSHVLDLGGAVDDVVIEMVPAATLRATVLVAPDDTPCPSGAVTLWDPTAEIVRAATIAPDGVASFPALPPGSYGVVLACDDHDSSQAPTGVEIEGTGAHEVTWRVQRGHAIQGHVRAADGHPLAGYVIAFAASKGPDGAVRWARIDEQGAYALQGLAAGDYSMTARVDDEPITARANVVDDDVVVDFVAPATVRLTGKVVRGAAPAAGVTVRATRPGAFGGPQTFAADDGSFAFEALSPGRILVTATDDLGNRSDELVVDLAADTPPLVIDLPAPRSIRGVVVDEHGGPVRDALVSARATSALGLDAARRPELRAAKVGGPGTSMSDAHGAFVIEGVAEGETYSVIAQRRGGGSATRAGVRAGDETRLELAPTATIAGTVRATKGPTSLWIELYADGGFVHRESFAGGSGAFEIDDLDAGVYELRAIAREGRGKLQVTAQAGTRTEIAMDLVGNRTLRGRLVDLEDGTPLGDLWAMFTEEGTSPMRVAIMADRAMQTRTPGLLTGTDGIFFARDVPPTTLQLLVISAGFLDDDDQHIMDVLLIPPSYPTDEVVDIPIVRPRLAFSSAGGDLGFRFRQFGFACNETPTVAEVVDPTLAVGLREGDEVVTVDGHDVADLRCYLARGLLHVPPGRTVALGLRRGETVTITARAPP